MQPLLQPLFMVRGTTQPINVVITTDVGDSRPLADGEILRFGLKKKPTDAECLVMKELSSTDAIGTERNEFVFVLNPTDTQNLDFGCYYYDVGLQNGVEYFNVIPCSEFHIGHNITSVGVSADA